MSKPIRLYGKIVEVNGVMNNILVQTNVPDNSWEIAGWVEITSIIDIETIMGWGCNSDNPMAVVFTPKAQHIVIDFLRKVRGLRQQVIE